MQNTSKDYIIKNIVFNRLSCYHIPYFVYMTVIGPHGGEYTVDEFNTEIILKEHFRVTMLPDITSKIMAQIGSHLDNVQFINYEGNIEELLKLQKNLLIRVSGIDKAKIIGQHLRLDYNLY